MTGTHLNPQSKICQSKGWLEITNRKLDVAYAGFLLAGGVVFLIIVIGFLPISTGDAGAIGLIILVPLSVLGLIGLCVGFLYATIFRFKAQLGLLSIISVLFVVEVFGEFGPTWFYNVINLTFSVATISISSWWFFVERNKVSNNT